MTRRGSSGFSRPGKCSTARQVLHVISSRQLAKKAVDVALRAEPRDRLVVRQKREVRTNPGRARGAAAQQIVTKHQQDMDHCQRLKDVGWEGLLSSSEFVALIRYGVVMAVVVGLGEDSLDCHLAGVRCEDLAQA